MQTLMMSKFIFQFQCFNIKIDGLLCIKLQFLSVPEPRFHLGEVARFSKRLLDVLRGHNEFTHLADNM